MREIRPYGSVRGVRSNPYPYRDMRKPDAEGSAKTLNPKTTFREGMNVTPTVPDSPHSPVRNRRQDRDRKAPLIGPGSGHGSAAPHPTESGSGSAPADGKAAPQTRRGPHPNPQLKKKLSERPGGPALTLTRSRIARPARPETPTTATLLGGSDQRVEHSRFTTFHPSSVEGPCTTRKPGKDRQRIGLLRKAQT